MKKVGIALIIVGFLAGALLAVLDTEIIESWTAFILAMAVGSGGVVLVKVASRQLIHATGAMDSNLKTVADAIDNIVKNIDALDNDKDSINTYDVRHQIDQNFLTDLGNFADAREAISHKYGMQAYADVMSIFAAGERYLNRVWSASADGYVDEVNTYIGRAREQFDSVKEELGKLQATDA